MAVALALLRAGAEDFFAVEEVFLAAVLVDVAVVLPDVLAALAVVAASPLVAWPWVPCLAEEALRAVAEASSEAVALVAPAALVAWVPVVLAFALVVRAAAAVSWVESCLRMRTTRASPRLARPT